MQYQLARPIFWSETGLVLRLTISDHVTVVEACMGWGLTGILRLPQVMLKTAGKAGEGGGRRQNRVGPT